MDSLSNIRTITNSALSKLKMYGYSQKDYVWLENIAVRFFRNKLLTTSATSVVWDNFAVGMASRTWSFPPSYVSLVGIFYKVDNSDVIIPLAINTSANLADDPSVCAPDPAPALNTPLSGIFGGWIWPTAYQGTTIYSSPGGYAENYYIYDIERQCIRFRTTVPVGKAIIAWKSNGRNVSGDTLVQNAYVDATENYLMWQALLLSPSWKNMSGEFKEIYLASMWDANTVAKAPTDQEIKDAIYRSSGFTLR